MSAEQTKQKEFYLAQIKAEKEKNRASEIKTLMSKASKPQIKRSLGFIKKLQNLTSDAQEIVSKFEERDVSENTVEANQGYAEVGDLLRKMEELLDHEMS